MVTGGIIVLLQTAVFLAAFVWAPKHSMLAARRRAHLGLEKSKIMYSDGGHMDLSSLTLPFLFPFMQNAFLIAIIVSVPTAICLVFL